MTNCYNCGHTGTFVLLVQFALAVPGPDAPEADRTPSEADRVPPEASGDRRPDRTDGRAEADEAADHGKADADEIPDSGGLSLAVQCPACDSTDVGVSAEDLLARYRSSTTS